MPGNELCKRACANSVHGEVYSIMVYCGSCSVSVEVDVQQCSGSIVWCWCIVVWHSVLSCAVWSSVAQTI